jgi:predicted metal-binding protein
MSLNLLPDTENINETYSLFYKEVSDILCIDYRSRDWCKLKYPGHLKGCPNFGLVSHEHCPPHCPKIENFIDLSKPHWFYICKFNLEKHANHLKEKHPDWSDKQIYCCLYWQGIARKHLNKGLEIFINSKIDNSDLTYTLLPEAMGVNVFKTLRRADIKFERNPKTFVLKIALIGYKLKN